MRCSHCFATHMQSSDKTVLSIDEIRKIASDARKLGCLHINLQGGEPLLLHNLEAYVQAIDPIRTHVSITTNGSLYNETWAQRLKHCKVRQLIFSIDYLDANKHDTFRAFDGAFDSVLKSIMHARDSGFSVTVNVTVSHQSLQDKAQRDLFDWLHKNKIYYNPILACAAGAWSDNMDCMVTPEDVLYVKSLQNKGFAQRDLDASWVKHGCSATVEQIYITPYGDVIPCPFIQISLGSLREEPLSMIWKRSLQQGLHGHYNPKCWVAQNHNFAKGLSDLYTRFEQHPISATVHEGKKFLHDYWK